MSARHIPCGVAVNESERQAITRLHNKLPDGWILLSNLNHSTSAAYPSDEIDLIVIGPPGITIVEVKHWDVDYFKKNAPRVAAEAEKTNNKAKRVAGKIRSVFDPGYVAAAMFLTRGGTGIAAGHRIMARGVPLFGLSEWKELVNADGVARLSPAQVQHAARLIEPRTSIAISGDLRHFGELINLERVESVDAPFHRVYRGQHPSRRDKVILHIFDLSAVEEKQPENRARREFEVIQRWQKSPYVPSLLDSFQEAEQYPGELFYFSLVDSAAPTLRERAADAKWSTDDRLRFAREALLALDGFHSPTVSEHEPLLHRNITPDTLRVRHNNQPLFTEFGFSRLVGAHTISSVATLMSRSEWAAPEMRTGGLAAADARSDVYMLCNSLRSLFTEQNQAASEAREWLGFGCAEEPQLRERPTEIAAAIERHTAPVLVGTVAAPLPPAEFWDEDTIVPFKESRYRIVNRLGRGGIGETFKVVELAANNDERFGTYVAKVIYHAEDAEPALRAYRKARQHTTHPSLSALYEIAPEWQRDCFAALLKWVEGVPLADLAGVLELHCEDLGEPSLEATVLRWLDSLCAALWQFHQVGLVHGDVSPRNIIVQGGGVVLTDYDTVTDVGQPPRSHNALYASDRIQSREPVAASDDLFALAASFFHTLFEREPFVFGATRYKNRGLNWEGIDVKKWPTLRRFLDRATHPELVQRFQDAQEARNYLKLPTPAAASAILQPPTPSVTLSPQVVPRLAELLSAYPGSRHGNAETRGLDSIFAEETYVNTGLDDALQREVREGDVDLIVLFGNAGDGKTAFLQNLTQAVTGERPTSQQRIWERRLKNGRMIRLNLDGSAAYQGKSANDLLEAFLKPFQSGDAHTARTFTHALAINSGKILEWLEQRDSETSFTESLRAALFGDGLSDLTPINPRFRLVDLNQRSLVGGYDAKGVEVGTAFLDALLDRFLGKYLVADPWVPCLSCSAQQRCSAWASVNVLRDGARGARVRRRLADALQASHLRGEIHITARELRAALVFIFFGIHYCEELHENPELNPAPYWDRAFVAAGAAAEGRQGELLAEVAHFDPALEADPILDRHLLRHGTPPERESPGGLASARRRAFFEWDEAELTALNLRRDVLYMHGARHLDRFRRVPVMTGEEREKLCRALCLGIARLEDLPAEAFGSQGLPLRITPRTPTESAFWVVKPWERFALTAPFPHMVQGLEVLHTHVLITYRSPQGREERLPIGLELFHLLLALESGAQLAGAAQEGIFAHLDLFVQRVAQEDVRELHAWHPEREGKVSYLRVELRNGKQTLIRAESAV